MVASFTGSSSPALKSCYRVALGLIWIHLQPPAWRAWFCQGCCGSLLTLWFKICCMSVIGWFGCWQVLVKLIWLLREKKKASNKTEHLNTFFKCDIFFQLCRFNIAWMVSFNHNIMLLAQNVRKKYFLIMTGEHNLWSDIKWNQRGMFSCGEQNSTLQFWRSNEMSEMLTDTLLWLKKTRNHLPQQLWHFP